MIEYDDDGDDDDDDETHDHDHRYELYYSDDYNFAASVAGDY